MTLFLIAMACGPKKTVEEAPKVGWHQEETWTFACYHPPQYEKMTEIERRDSWQGSMEAMAAQWRGDRGDGVQVDERTLDRIDLQFSAYPQKVEKAAQENLDKCKQAATGAISKDAWLSWINQLPEQLTAGECRNHFLDTVLDDLNITVDFENSFPICEGDRIQISGATQDQYRITSDGEWITIAGDLNSSSVGKEHLPCNIEGCYDGMLILRFTDLDDRVTVYPVGGELEFKAPRDGFISYGINDDTFYDNQWYQSGGLIDHASVTIAPTAQ